MVSRFLAGAVCATCLLVATCANADPGYYPMSNFLAMFSAVPRSVVSFPGKYEPGTIIVSTRERRLYLVLGKGQALRYGIGVGRDGFTWSGTSTITDEAGVAGLDAARRDAATAARSAASYAWRPGQSARRTRNVPGRYSCIASMARTSRTRSAPPRLRGAFD